ncbi:MAG TPA: 50S ribosomal protein L23 [Saprospiraceae bacterium]|nr:50S ribosomal protein L23 [Saprospiraceae bacterium]HNT21181.1 50S ribosomal protein L23 [Saprospiraceae bacterium]
MEKKILIRPIISEKAEKLSSAQPRYTFLVNKDANKIEIQKAVQQHYGVTVKDVNTLTNPGKKKSRSTKRRVSVGIKPSYKKAVVTLNEGDSINIYGEI